MSFMTIAPNCKKIESLSFGRHRVYENNTRLLEGHYDIDQVPRKADHFERTSIILSLVRRHPSCKRPIQNTTIWSRNCQCSWTWWGRHNINVNNVKTGNNANHPVNTGNQSLITIKWSSDSQYHAKSFILKITKWNTQGARHTIPLKSPSCPPAKV